MSDYSTLGQASTPEARLAAARASIALTFGLDWVGQRTVAYMHSACEKLDAFADDDAYKQAGSEVDLLELPTDGVVEGIIWPALEGFKKHFPMTETPPGRKYWLEVLRYARKATQEVRNG